MRKVILQIDVSLDGFIAGANGETDWVTSEEVMNQDASTLLDTVDTILLGRVAYQDFSSFWPFADMTAPTTISKITSQINHADKIIFSKTLDQVEWGAFNNARLIRDNVPEEISKLKSSFGKNLLLYAGRKIISTFIHDGLIDEYHLRVHPVVLGKGMALFPTLDDRLKLSLTQAKAYKNGAVLLVYTPA